MTTIVENGHFDHFAAAQLRGQIRILAAGMTIRGLTKTQALARASKITGTTYKRGEFTKAIDGLTTWIDARKEQTQ